MVYEGEKSLKPPKIPPLPIQASATIQNVSLSFGVHQITAVVAIQRNSGDCLIVNGTAHVFLVNVQLLLIYWKKNIHSLLRGLAFARGL